MKRLFFYLLTNVALLAFIIGVQPTSWGTYHQPELPEELR